MSLLALLSSCIARSGVAVSGSASSVTIHLARCSAHERIVDVRVAQVGRNEIPDDRDDIVLWRAQSKQGVPVNSVTVGNPPEGLDETIPLTHPLDKTTEYFALVRSTVDGIAFFRPSELSGNRVLYENHLVSPAEFQKEALSGGKCARSFSDGKTLARLLPLLAAIALVAGGAIFMARRGTRPPGRVGMNDHAG